MLRIFLSIKKLKCFSRATEKSEAIACARRCQSSRSTGWWTRKEQLEKMESKGGGEAQGVPDPPKKEMCFFGAAPDVDVLDVLLEVVLS
jgi:hypothetical protein